DVGGGGPGGRGGGPEAVSALPRRHLRRRAEQWTAVRSRVLGHPRAVSGGQPDQPRLPTAGVGVHRKPADRLRPHGRDADGDVEGSLRTSVHILRLLPPAHHPKLTEPPSPPPPPRQS